MKQIVLFILLISGLVLFAQEKPKKKDSVNVALRKQTIKLDSIINKMKGDTNEVRIFDRQR